MKDAYAKEKCGLEISVRKREYVVALVAFEVYGGRFASEVHQVV